MDEPPIRALYIGDLAHRAQGSKPTPKLAGTRDVICVYVGVQCIEKLKPKLRQELNISVNPLEDGVDDDGLARLFIRK
jgi:hypothetical protein